MLLLTAPEMLTITARSFDRVNLSPMDDGNTAARPRVKILEVVLKRVTKAASLGSSAN